MPENSINNRIIHGDNLESLKSLLPELEGKIDLIYIDPPYNTGNEGWVYNDAVNDPKIKKWLGQVVGKEGEDLSRHDKWLCMMYPRLKLLHRLLADDGLILVSIDDNEESSLRLLMNDIFGQRNYITNFIWRKVDSPNDNKVPVTPDHEYIVAYAKSMPNLKLLQMSAPGIVKAYGSEDETGRRYRDRLLKKNGKNSLRRDRPTMYFALEAPDGSDVFPIHENGEEARWAMGKAGIEKHKAANALIWKKRSRNGQEVWEPYTREFAPDVPTRPYPTIWADLPTMRQAKAFLRDVFNTADLFDTPKPVELLERLLEMTGKSNAIVLDSFAGSGTTAHAVLKLNAQDDGNRRFIMCEMMDYAETITAERVRRVINGYGEGDKAVD
ncbi:MAG: type III restriction endonuclease subunit M, partial [Azospira oryzae]